MQKIIEYKAGHVNPDTVPFNDMNVVGFTGGHHKVHKICMFTDGKYCLGVRFFYTATGGITHPIDGGYHLGQQHQGKVQEIILELGSDEWITKVYGKSGNIVDHLGFVTNKGRSAECGGSGGNFFELIAPNGSQFNTFYGGIGGHLHWLGGYVSIAPLLTLFYRHQIPNLLPKV
jgi:hypothetical protein